MALRRNKADDDRVTRDRDATDEHAERAGASPGLVRTLFTLAGVAAAGFLIWLASTFDWDGSTSGFWIAAALLAGAGLALGLSQLFGGWTKWGWPTLSPTVFLLGFLPTLIVGGWILLAKQPQDGVQEGRVDGWSDDIGIGGLVDALFELWPAIPLIIGLILAFSFDTTGPRTHIVRNERTVRDEDVHDYRREDYDQTVDDRVRARDTVATTSAGARAADVRRTDIGDTTRTHDVGTTRPPDVDTTRTRDAETTGARRSDIDTTPTHDVETTGGRSSESSSVAEELRRREGPDSERRRV